jgi:hypothetical protein
MFKFAMNLVNTMYKVENLQNTELHNSVSA